MSVLYRFLVVLVVVGVVTSSPAQIRTAEQNMAEEEAMMAAKNAHYSFSSDIDDKISDLTIHRDETREGLNTMGSFSYSDGFQMRTVEYVADDKGYRILSEKIQTLNNGPHVNPSGTASVSAHLPDGTNVNYKIQSVP